MICPILVTNEKLGPSNRFQVHFHREMRNADGVVLCLGSGASNEDSRSNSVSNQRIGLMDGGSSD